MAPSGKIPLREPPYNWPSVDCNSPAERETMSEPIKHHLPQRALPSDMPFPLNPPTEPTLLALVTLQRSSLRAPRPTISVPRHVPSEKPNHSATRPPSPLSSHLAQFTSQIFPPRPSPSIPGHLHFVPSLTDDYSVSRPPGEADMRAHQPRSVYVYPVKRGDDAIPVPTHPSSERASLEDMSRFSPVGTVLHSQRLEVPRTFPLSRGVMPYSAGL